MTNAESSAFDRWSLASSNSAAFGNRHNLSMFIWSVGKQVGKINLKGKRKWIKDKSINHVKAVTRDRDLRMLRLSKDSSWPGGLRMDKTSFIVLSTNYASWIYLMDRCSRLFLLYICDIAKMSSGPLTKCSTVKIRFPSFVYDAMITSDLKDCCVYFPIQFDLVWNWVHSTIIRNSY